MDNLLGSGDGEEGAVSDKGDAVAAEGFVHVGGGDEECDALGGEGAEHIPEFAAGNGVDSGGGFVEEEDAGFVDKGAAEGEFLFHAS